MVGLQLGREGKFFLVAFALLTLSPTALSDVILKCGRNEFLVYVKRTDSLFGPPEYLHLNKSKGHFYMEGSEWVPWCDGPHAQSRYPIRDERNKRTLYYGSNKRQPKETAAVCEMWRWSTADSSPDLKTNRYSQVVVDFELNTWTTLTNKTGDFSHGAPSKKSEHDCIQVGYDRNDQGFLCKNFGTSCDDFYSNPNTNVKTVLRRMEKELGAELGLHETLVHVARGIGGGDVSGTIGQDRVQFEILQHATIDDRAYGVQFSRNACLGKTVSKGLFTFCIRDYSNPGEAAIYRFLKPTEEDLYFD